MNMSKLIYKRALLKLSGESLMGDTGYGIDTEALDREAEKLKEIKEKTDVELAIVIGGGNIFRGMKAATQSGMNRAVADHMGMLATVINALAVQDTLERKGLATRVMTAFPILTVAEHYTRRRALSHMEKGKIVILSAGTGHPYFTTDTAAALRAAELGCDVMLKATTIDGVYDKDPKEYPKEAKKYDNLDYETFLLNNLQIMDATAVSLCRSVKMPILVFDLTVPGNIIRALEGENIGTRISCIENPTREG